jgi:hypothetical protein
MCKIVRSVYRVNGPPEQFVASWGLLEYLALVTFLGDKAVVGICLFDSVDDYLLAPGIGLEALIKLISSIARWPASRAATIAVSSILLKSLCSNTIFRNLWFVPCGS